MKVSIAQVFWGQLTATVPPVVEKNLEGQTVVVTGANVGLGFEAAKHFARMNPGKLIIACRDQQRGNAALQSTPTLFCEASLYSPYLAQA